MSNAPPRPPSAPPPAFIPRVRPAGGFGGSPGGPSGPRPPVGPPPAFGGGPRGLPMGGPRGMPGMPMGGPRGMPMMGSRPASGMATPVGGTGMVPMLMMTPGTPVMMGGTPTMVPGSLFPASGAATGGGFGPRPPASFGTLRVTVAGCKNLPSNLANQSSKMFVRAKLGDQEKRGAPAREGGARPRFGDDFLFDVRMDREMEIALVLPSGDGQPDNVMGVLRANVMPWIAQGSFSGDIEMKDSMFQPVGMATISVSFQRNAVPSVKPGDTAGAAAAAAAAAAPIPGSSLPSTGNNTLFSDEEIRDAFVQFDLDKNNFVGAAEVRHVLISIGESVTDEEVDEMIRMVDRSGGGQVGFPEFYRMVTGGREPPLNLYQGSGTVPYAPSASPMAPARAGVPSLAPSAAGGADNAPDGPAAVAARNAKRKSLEDLVRAFGINADGVRRAFNDFDAGDKGSGLADYATFCDVLRVEPGKVAEDAFSRFDTARSGKILFKEFALGLMNTAPSSREEKVKFAYHLYDDNADGILTKDELIKVLRGNHMAASDKEVMRKADTILAQAESNAGGEATISMAEFEKVATRFPNICFPAAKGGR